MTLVLVLTHKYKFTLTTCPVHYLYLCFHVSFQFNGKPGDLIEIFRWGYKHWAVYIGGQEVVHFTTDGE